MNNKKPTDRLTVRVAVYLVLIKNGKVLLSKRKNTGWMDGFYTIVGGHVEKNESIYDAMIREAQEEIGITVASKDLSVIHMLYRTSSYIDIFLSVSRWSGQIKNMEENKCEELQWFSLDSLPENLVTHNKVMLNAYNNKQIFSEFSYE